MKDEIRIRVQCTKVKDHAKILHFNPQFTGLAFVEALAALIDGTHQAYIHPPGTNSPIGRCAMCGATLKCMIEIIEEAPDLEEDLRASLEEENAKPGK